MHAISDLLMENEERIYICCEKAEGKENFTCIKTSKETSINLILTASTLQDKRQNRMLNRMPIQSKINNLVGELAHDHDADPQTARLY